ncbi:MAG: hypothetical protein ABI758_02690 [Candidatus Woesebacteria bacterium]
MKKIATTLLFLLFSVAPVYAQTNMCNQKCEVDGDCSSGYRCYVGVCRLNSCPSSSTCSCAAGTTSPTPASTIRPTTTPKPTVSPSPKVSPSPTPIASLSAKLKHSPKTGFETWLVAGGAIALFGVGSVLGINEKVFATRKLSPRELVKRRQSSST